MEAIERTRQELVGSEFDWLVADANGCLALCLTAGCGEVPDSLLRHGGPQLERYSAAVASILDRVPENGSCRQEGRGVGADLESLGYATRGLYLFDWKHWSGPYQRIVVPELPVQGATLADVLGDFAALVPTLPMSFAGTRRFQLYELLACSRLHGD